MTDTNKDALEKRLTDYEKELKELCHATGDYDDAETIHNDFQTIRKALADSDKWRQLYKELQEEHCEHITQTACEMAKLRDQAREQE